MTDKTTEKTTEKPVAFFESLDVNSEPIAGDNGNPDAPYRFPEGLLSTGNGSVHDRLDRLERIVAFMLNVEHLEVPS